MTFSPFTPHCGERGTVANKHVGLKSMLLFAGVAKEIITPKPRYEKQLPTITGRAGGCPDGIPEGAAEACHLGFLMCGLREQN